MSIKEQISNFLKIDDLKDNIIRLIGAKFELKKLEVEHQLVEAAAKLLFYVLLSIIGIIMYAVALGWIIRIINVRYGNGGELTIIVIHAIIMISAFMNKQKITTAFYAWLKTIFRL